MNQYHLHHGDSLDVLKTLAPDSLDSCVTDPPYELGFMGRKWDSTGIANSVDLWRGVLRALKPGAFLVAFSGTRTYHRMTCAIEDAGFEIRDQLAWCYGSGFPKSKNLPGGLGTALKPAWEPICLARKPLIGTVAANVAAFGTGALNIDGCRIDGREGDQTNGAAKTGNAYGNIQREAGKIYPATLGRWPANLMHDGSAEVVACFPESDGAQGAVTGTEPSSASNGTSCFGAFARTANSVPRGHSGSAARFFYCAKASKWDREEGCFDAGLTERKAQHHIGQLASVDGRQDLNRANVHPTVKPTDLMRWLCRIVTPKGGTVLDPFTGSGSTGRAAILEQFRFVGIEREAEYVAIARARINEAIGPLFL